jgi:hypothetical protein
MTIPIPARLLALDPCSDARAWLDEERPTSLRAAWDTCPRGDWLVWVVGQAHIYGALTRQRLVQVALRAIEPVCHLLTTEQVADLGVVARWPVGEATLDEVREARERLYARYIAADVLRAARAASVAAALAADAAALAACDALAALRAALAACDAASRAAVAASDATYAATTAAVADVVRAAITLDEVAAALGWDADERWTP